MQRTFRGACRGGAARFAASVVLALAAFSGARAQATYDAQANLAVQYHPVTNPLLTQSKDLVELTLSPLSSNVDCTTCTVTIHWIVQLCQPAPPHAPIGNPSGSAVVTASNGGDWTDLIAYDPLFGFVRIDVAPVNPYMVWHGGSHTPDRVKVGYYGLAPLIEACLSDPYARYGW